MAISGRCSATNSMLSVAAAPSASPRGSKPVPGLHGCVAFRVRRGYVLPSVVHAQTSRPLRNGAVGDRLTAHGYRGACRATEQRPCRRLRPDATQPAAQTNLGILVGAMAVLAALSAAAAERTLRRCFRARSRAARRLDTSRPAGVPEMQCSKRAAPGSEQCSTRRSNCSTSADGTRTRNCPASPIGCTSPPAKRRSPISCCFAAAISIGRARVGIGAHPALHALPARRKHPAGCLSRRCGRPRSDHAGRVDVQPGISFGRKGGKNTLGLRARGAEFPGPRHAVGIGYKSGDRPRFQGDLLSRSTARLLVVGPVDHLLGQQRRTPGGVLARTAVLFARHPPGGRRVAARRSARRFALRPGRDHRPVRDAREVRECLLGLLERPE